MLGSILRFIWQAASHHQHGRADLSYVSVSSSACLLGSLEPGFGFHAAGIQTGFELTHRTGFDACFQPAVYLGRQGIMLTMIPDIISGLFLDSATKVDVTFVPSSQKDM